MWYRGIVSTFPSFGLGDFPASCILPLSPPNSPSIDHLNISTIHGLMKPRSLQFIQKKEELVNVSKRWRTPSAKTRIDVFSYLFMRINIDKCPMKWYNSQRKSKSKFDSSGEANCRYDRTGSVETLISREGNEQTTDTTTLRTYYDGTDRTVETTFWGTSRTREYHRKE